MEILPMAFNLLCFCIGEGNQNCQEYNINQKR